jgi:hypothetical protein
MKPITDQGTDMELPIYTSLVTLLIALYYLWVGIHVGIVRGKVKIPPLRSAATRFWSGPFACR